MVRSIVEYTKTGESLCKNCDSMIEKNAVRVGRAHEQDHTPCVTWYHLHCLTPVHASSALSAAQGQGINVPGVSDLREDDQEPVAKAIEKLAKGTSPGEAMPKRLIGPAMHAPEVKLTKKQIRNLEQEEEEAMMPPAPSENKRERKHKMRAATQGEFDEGELREEAGDEQPDITEMDVTEIPLQDRLRGTVA